YIHFSMLFLSLLSNEDNDILAVVWQFPAYYKGKMA
ncbi:hypothetical protein NT07LI_4080, partial [Listeria innocua FSL S4-378]